MNYFRRIKQAVQAMVAYERADRLEFVGVLGDHNGVVPAGDGLVYMTLHNGQVIRLLNRRVPNIGGRPVVAGYDASMPNVLQVLYSRGVFGDSDIQPSVPNHHDTHEYPGHDAIFLKPEQFLPLLTLPVSGFTVQVFGGVVRQADNGGWTVISNQQVDLSSYVPAVGARYVLIDASNGGVLSIIIGTLVDSIDALSSSVIPEPSNIPIACIRLYDGQDQIRREANINDFVEVRALASNAYNDSSAQKTGVTKRLLSDDLTLLDAECLIVTQYFDTNNYTLELQGDSVLEVL